MAKFPLTARVRRVVVDTVSLTVEANSKEEAFDKARNMLTVFPDPHDVEGIGYCYIEDRQHTDNQVLDIEEEKGVA